MYMFVLYLSRALVLEFFNVVGYQFPLPAPNLDIYMVYLHSLQSLLMSIFAAVSVEICGFQVLYESVRFRQLCNRTLVCFLIFNPVRKFSTFLRVS